MVTGPTRENRLVIVSASYSRRPAERKSSADHRSRLVELG
jgi:hypothetical protein